MAQDKPIKPKGSIVLKLLIVIFFALMLVSILIPKAEWDRQKQERNKCRLRMENLSYVIREYGAKKLGYVDDLEEYLTFIKSDTVEVNAPRYDLESLTRDPESGKDSLLLDFSDEFRLSHFDYDVIRRVATVGDSIIPDSVHVYAVPRDEFSGIPVTTLILTSDDTIFVTPRERNIRDHAVLLHSNKQIRYEWMTPDPKPMPATEAIISLPADSLELCPTARLPYKLNVNVRSVLEGTVNYTVNKDTVKPNILQDSLMLDLFNHRLKTEALAEVLVLVKEDTTLIEKKDSILVAHFLDKLAAVKPKQTYEVNGDYTINVPADSMVNWQDSLRIRDAVFVAHVDSLSEVLKSLDEFLALAPMVSYEESYTVSKVDTVGVTIRCPIDPGFRDPDQSLIHKIFGVGAPANHGYVENGDLSWSEKK